MYDKSLLTTEEAAPFLRTSAKTLRRWARDRLLPSIKIGRRLLFRREALELALKRLESKSVL
jgi:excisionase family DNA binding protein